MATAIVPTRWVSDGTLGGTCLRHGVPSRQRRRRTFATATPPWVYLLLLVSWVVVVIVVFAIRTTVEADLPECERCVGRRRLTVMGAVASLILALVFFVAGVLREHSGLYGVAAVLALAGILALLAVDRVCVRGVLSTDGASVTLTGVDPTAARLLVAAQSGYDGPSSSGGAVTLLPRG